MWGQNRIGLTVIRKFTALVLPALIHTTCGILLAYVVTNGLVRFSKYESRALTKLQKTSEADFFAITLCPDYKQAYNSEKLKMLGLKKNGYISGNYTGNSSDSGWTIFQQVTSDINDIIDELSVHTTSPKGLLHHLPYRATAKS